MKQRSILLIFCLSFVSSLLNAAAESPEERVAKRGVMDELRLATGEIERRKKNTDVMGELIDVVTRKKAAKATEEFKRRLSEPLNTEKESSPRDEDEKVVKVLRQVSEEKKAEGRAVIPKFSSKFEVLIRKKLGESDSTHPWSAPLHRREPPEANETPGSAVSNRSLPRNKSSNSTSHCLLQHSALSRVSESPRAKQRRQSMPAVSHRNPDDKS